MKDEIPTFKAGELGSAFFNHSSVARVLSNTTNSDQKVLFPNLNEAM